MITLRRACALLFAAATAAVALGSMAPTSAAPATTSPAPVRHVFVIVLENKDYAETFGPNSAAPYLAKTLREQGQLLTNYYGIGHVSLDNYIAMISGQAPNPITQSDCQQFTDFVPPTAVLDPNGQAIGQGCVYPAGVPTLPGQLEQAGRTWKGYMDGMGTPCRHPALNARDETQAAKPGAQYASRHNPFVYFHSIIDDDVSCRKKVVDLAALPTDLATVESTPSFSFITPDLCHDGHDAPCVDGQPGGLKSIDAFLQTWVPKILTSPAYQQDGMLLVTFDEAEPGSPTAADACCGEIPGPNSPLPGIYGMGGGRVGGVVLSPFVQPGTVNDTPYNHYSLLRSVEDIFGLSHLGFAAAADLRPFGADVFNAVAPAAARGPLARAQGGDSRPGGVSLPRSLPASGAAIPFGAVAAALALGLLGLTVGRRALRG